ncbi:MAG: penicillin-binding protein [Chitinophagaceae bacterium]
MRFFSYITHRPLWFNILVAILLAIIVFVVLVLSLQLCTHHGQSKTVPNVMGKTYDEAVRILDQEGFEVIVQDSVIYIDTLKPLTVIKQIPESDEVVKVNRTVYLTLNRAVPPLVEMPNLIGFSYRNAEMTLENMGLKVGDTIYKSDFAKNSVLDQLYQGQHINPGSKLRMGSNVTLVLGTGVGDMKFIVPSLVGRTYGEAKTVLEANGLNIIAIPEGPITDTMNAYVHRQDPQRYDDEGRPQYIRTGQIITVWIGTGKRAAPDTTAVHQLPQ